MVLPFNFLQLALKVKQIVGADSTVVIFLPGWNLLRSQLLNVEVQNKLIFVFLFFVLLQRCLDDFINEVNSVVIVSFVLLLFRLFCHICPFERF